MGHDVRLIVGRGAAIAAFLVQWPGLRIVNLRGEWRAIPVDDALYDAFAAKHPGAARHAELDFAPPGLPGELAAAAATGGLAYIETNYFGGTGTQGAMAFAGGREVVSPQSGRGPGPINAALRAIGVVQAGGADEFDTVGLGERRSMDDYGVAEPVEASVEVEGMAGKPQPQQEPANRLPAWVVVLLMAFAIGGGVWMAVGR